MSSSYNTDHAERFSIPETLVSRCSSSTGVEPQGVEPHGFVLPQHYVYTKATLEKDLKRALGWGVRKHGVTFSREILQLLGEFCFHVINFHEQYQGGISLETTHVLEITERVFRIYEPECFVRFENLFALDLSFITVRSWKNVVFPRKLGKLNLSQSNFRGTLRYLRDLKYLKMCDLQLDSWVDVMPPNLIDLDASFSNFNGDIRFLIQLKRLNLTGVKHSNWRGTCFPRSLESLNLDKSDFRGDLAYLINLQPAHGARRTVGGTRRVSFSEPAVITFEDDYEEQYKRVFLTPLKTEEPPSKIIIKNFKKENRKNMQCKKGLIAFAFDGKPKLQSHAKSSRQSVITKKSKRINCTKKRRKEFMQHLKPERASRARSRLEYVRWRRKVGKAKEVTTRKKDFPPAILRSKRHHKKKRAIAGPLPTQKGRVPPEILSIFSCLAEQYRKECPNENIRFKAWADERMKLISEAKCRKHQTAI